MALQPGRAGHSVAGSLSLLTEQSSRRYAQCVGDRKEAAQRDVSLATLDAAYIRSMQAARVCQTFLGQSRRETRGADATTNALEARAQSSDTVGHRRTLTSRY